MTASAIERLVPHRARFVSFVASRVPDRGVAEDLVQLAFMRAVEKGTLPDDESRSLAWFYRVLLNAVTDYHRRRAADARTRDRYRADPTSAPAPQAGRTICGCVRRALSELPPKSREVLERVEVGGLGVAEFAAGAGITSGNASVRLHRARRLLEARVRETCGSCSLDGCADCDCGRGSHGFG